MVVLPMHMPAMSNSRFSGMRKVRASQIEIMPVNRMAASEVMMMIASCMYLYRSGGYINFRHY